MVQISSPGAVRKMNALVFGPSGQGKTTFIGTAQDDPRTFPLLIVDFEGGLSSIAHRQVDTVRIQKWTDFREVVQGLRDGTLVSEIADPGKPFKAVAVDSISESHIFALMRLLEGDKRRAVTDLLDPGDYGQALIQMRRLLRDFRDLPIHFFATALAKSDVDPQVGTIFKPSLVGALADEAPGIFDCVTYLAVQDIAVPNLEGEGTTTQTQRVLVLQNIPKFRTKVRVPTIVTVPDSIPNPTIASLLDAVGIQ